MQKLKLGKGAVGKEFWQIGGGGGGGGGRGHSHAGGLGVGASGQGRQRRSVHRIGGGSRMKQMGCCARLRMYEENARFALLAGIMLIYLLLGALIFHYVECDLELSERAKYSERLSNFRQKYCRDQENNKNSLISKKLNSKNIQFKIAEVVKSVNCSELDDLLDLRGNLSAAGLTSPRLKWDWSGSFYFVGTVVSTIGFGMTTPRTNTGKALVILYGFFGCAGAILLFNLFLERIITLFAHTLRFVHEKRQRRFAISAGNTKNNQKPQIRIVRTADSDDDSGSEASLEQWRPSVYVVMTCLFMLSVTLVLSAAGVYQYVEKWTYFESIYFCFVSFSTIGFGDYVSSQQQTHETPNIGWYRAANFLFLTLGCCCIYSLFNVTSIIIRQFLNRLLRKLDCRCRRPKCLRRSQQRPYLGLGLRPPTKSLDRLNNGASGVVGVDSDSEASASSRRPSGTSAGGSGIISLKEFLEQNKMNIFLMQKHIIESAQQRFQDRQYDTSSAISASAVGPLAILSKKFGDD